MAGPDPDERGNPVGLVFIGLATPDGTWVRKVNLSMGRQRIRHIAASHGFDLARRYLSGLELKSNKTRCIFHFGKYTVFFVLVVPKTTPG